MRRSFIVAGAIVALTALSPALAAVVDFSTELTQLDGRPFADPADRLSPAEQAVVDGLVTRGYTLQRPKKTTLGDVVVQALLLPVQGEDPKEKMRKFTLAQHIQDAMASKLQEHSKLDLPLEDMAFIKDVIGKNYPPLIMGQAWRILDPASVSK